MFYKKGSPINACKLRNKNRTMGEPRMAKPECRWKSPNDWAEWSQWLAAGLDARHRWRLPVLLGGVLFARGRAHGHDLAAGRRHRQRVRRLLLLPVQPRTGERKAVAYHLLLLEDAAPLPLPERLLAVIDDSARRSAYGLQAGGWTSTSTIPRRARPIRCISARPCCWVTAVAGPGRHPRVGRWPCRFGPSCTSGS